MKKKLNIDIIQSELRGGSAFFPGYKRNSSPTPAASPDETSQDTAPRLTQDLKDQTQIHTPPPQPPNAQQDAPVSEIAVEGVPPPVPRTVPRRTFPEKQLIPKNKRVMKQRQPFDIYEDQYILLKKIADAERGFINGRGMSQMVRDAIDAYLASHTSSGRE